MKLEDLVEKSQVERKAAAGVKADQFFTRPEAAEHFAQWIKRKRLFDNVSRIIEPAAGSKDIAQHFPGIEMYDLFPQSQDITQQDFLQSSFRYQPGTLVVMNPPYGRSSALAIQFFNKAASFADYIAAIVPRTFRRGSIQNRLSRDFHLVDEYILPKNSFYLPSERDMKPYDVPAVAQIWERRNVERTIEKPVRNSEHFDFVSPDQATFAIRRKGRRAGQITTDIASTNPNSFYYIKGDQDVLQAFQQVDWSKMGHDVIGARSISQPEIVNAVEQFL